MVQRVLCSVAGREWSKDLTLTSMLALSIPAAYPRSLSPVGESACDALAEVLHLAGVPGMEALVGAAVARIRRGPEAMYLEGWVCPPLPMPIQEAWALESWGVER